MGNEDVLFVLEIQTDRMIRKNTAASTSPCRVLQWDDANEKMSSPRGYSKLDD
jgi:hypothetical protein